MSCTSAELASRQKLGRREPGRDANVCAPLADLPVPPTRDHVLLSVGIYHPDAFSREKKLPSHSKFRAKKISPKVYVFFIKYFAPSSILSFVMPSKEGGDTKFHPWVCATYTTPLDSNLFCTKTWGPKGYFRGGAGSSPSSPVHRGGGAQAVLEVALPPQHQPLRGI